MSTLSNSHILDLESAGGGRLEGGGVPSNEIVVGVAEKRGGDGDGDDGRRRESTSSECSVKILDLEVGEADAKLQQRMGRTDRDCRICHLSMDAASLESGVPIELGCSCKDDLAAAHKQCAEAWFKIKGNKTCEICGSIAQNVAGAAETESTDPWNETNDAAAISARPEPPVEARNFWQGHRFLNFLLACMVFAFVVSWLFHFNVPS